MARVEVRIDDPVEQAIARLRAIYRNWDKTTSVTQMRADWDAAFAVPVMETSVAAVGGLLPPPLRGRVGEGGRGGSSGSLTPTPNPSPPSGRLRPSSTGYGGGEHAARAVSQRIRIGDIDAEWIGDPAPGRPTILYFHGGGFRLGSVASHRDLISRIAQATRSRVLAVDYRLAPEHRFPAAVEDAQAAYDHLLTQGVDPGTIVMMGDSAGGNLVLAAMLSLRARKQPLPKAAVLMSPWTDMAATGESYASRAAVDPIHQRNMILGLAKNYLGDADPRDPLASPLYADLGGLPPLLIQVGDRETVRDDSLMLARKAEAAGVAVTLEVWDGMIHVFQLFPKIPQSHDAIASIARFIDAQSSDRRSS